MTDVDKYAPGTPCWIELSTTDLDAALRFYGAVLGWGFDSGALPDGNEYVMPHLRDRAIGGMYARPGDQKDIPPRWLLFVAVNDADDTASRVTALGGRLTDPPYDVMDSGRMAVLQDPTGATVALWQAGRAIGSRVTNEPGAFSWAELATRDAHRAATFYCGLFGWDVKEAPDGSYTEFQVDDQSIAGMLTMDERHGDAPPHWLAYFGASDCDAAAALVESKGGRVEMPPTDIPNVGRIAVAADPQGARFALWAEATP
jgi:predicted enzyme related to lactoylglutathione lyase